MLEVVDLETCYGNIQALFGMNLCCAEGEVTTLLGRNGMGKTTTVSSIIGLLASRAGEVRFNGQAVNNWPAYQIAQLGIGLVPEGRQIFPNLSVRENLVATAANYSGSDDPWTLERVLEFFPRLQERLGNQGRQLSGGEQQMLAIGRALARDIKVLLLDEPYEGLAPVIVHEIERTLRKIKEIGITTVIVEQNAVAALNLADRAVILDTGKVVFDGTAKEVLDNEKLRHEYLAI